MLDCNHNFFHIALKFFKLYFFFLGFKYQIRLFTLLYSSIGQMSRVFTNDPADQVSISGQVIPKTQKMVLDATLLNTQYYKVRIKVKWSNPGNGVAPSPTPWCSSYWKESLQVTFD